MLTLQLVWSKIKSYWQLIAALVIFIAGYFLFRSKSEQKISDVLAETKKRHDEEVEAIKKAYEKQIVDDKIAFQRLQDTLEKVERQYEKAQKDLDEKKRKEVIKIISETKDNPDELAKRLQESTGFTIVID